MRTALYARVSTERQERQQTIDSQLTALRGWAAANGHLYRPRLVGHLVAAYAARAAVESRSWRTELGGLNPCRSISHVAL
jgi:DNA invertase Pin-like site-specific DNA recombinase